MQGLHRRLIAFEILLAALVLAGCSSPSLTRAPVEDRSSVPVARSVDPATLPGAENAGKPGYYTVRPGDTIRKIAVEVNQNWRDIASWNQLPNPDVIEVGQVLRVVPPAGFAAPAATAAATPVTVAPAPAPVEAPRSTQQPVPVATQTTPGVVAPVPAPPASSPAPVRPVPPPPPSAGADDIKFRWPASGSVITSFDETKSKGIAIAGKVGEPVLAAADGKVVYAGTGLRGYGNLVIIEHNSTFLTAYAHNQKLLVKEDEMVKRGQKIAEMGSTDADRVKLHFEIRRSGKPVDPLRYLPPR